MSYLFLSKKIDLILPVTVLVSEKSKKHKLVHMLGKVSQLEYLQMFIVGL